MPVATLTARGIEALSAKASRVDVWDTEVKGLHLRVSPNGDKVFAVWYRVHQQPHRLTIGHWPAMTLKAARVRALEVLADAGKGIDGVATKRAAAADEQQRKLRGDSFQALAEKCP